VHRTSGGRKCEALQGRRPRFCTIQRDLCRIGGSGRFGRGPSAGWRGPGERGRDPVDFPHGRPACARCDKREEGTGCSDNGSAGQCWAPAVHTAKKIGAQVIAGVRGKELDDARSLGYTAVLPESAAAKNPRVKITRVRAQPDPSKRREFADDVRDGKFVLPIGRPMPLRDAAEAHVLGEKGGIGKILLLAADSQH
jgi:hypothetical protein